MDQVASDLTAQAYSREQMWRARTALGISIVSLLRSAWTLFETALRQPKFTPYAAGNWKYGRGTVTNDEIFIVPITIDNHGARPGAILRIEMIVGKAGGGERRFVSTGILLNEKDRGLFAPVSVQGRSSYTASIIFSSQAATDRNQPQRALIDAPGTYTARLSFCSTYNQAFGLFDTLLASVPNDLSAEINLRDFNAARLDAGRTEDVGGTISQAPPSPGRRDAGCTF
jgi:hypothetical protein